MKYALPVCLFLLAGLSAPVASDPAAAPGSAEDHLVILWTSGVMVF